MIFSPDCARQVGAPVFRPLMRRKERQHRNKKRNGYSGSAEASCRQQAIQPVHQKRRSLPVRGILFSLSMLPFRGRLRNKRSCPEWSLPTLHSGQDLFHSVLTGIRMKNCQLPCPISPIFPDQDDRFFLSHNKNCNSSGTWWPGHHLYRPRESVPDSHVRRDSR